MKLQLMVHMNNTTSLFYWDPLTFEFINDKFKYCGLINNIYYKISIIEIHDSLRTNPFK